MKIATAQYILMFSNAMLFHTGAALPTADFERGGGGLARGIRTMQEATPTMSPTAIGDGVANGVDAVGDGVANGVDAVGDGVANAVDAVGGSPTMSPTKQSVADNIADGADAVGDAFTPDESSASRMIFATSSTGAAVFVLVSLAF